MSRFSKTNYILTLLIQGPKTYIRYLDLKKSESLARVVVVIKPGMVLRKGHRGDRAGRIVQPSEKYQERGRTGFQLETVHLVQGQDLPHQGGPLKTEAQLLLY